MMKTTPQSFLVSFAALIGPSHAVTERLFATTNAHLVDARMDPLVNPGTCAAHVHSVFGSTAFASELSRSDVRDSEWRNDGGKELQTTSNVIPNLSLYWAPALYIFDPATELYFIVPSFSRTYYRIEHNNDISVINPIPMYLQLIAGDATRTTPWRHTERHDDIRWTIRRNRQRVNSIEHGDWTYLRERPELVANNDQLEMNIEFPNCLELTNGGRPRTKSRDFRSHAAYAIRNRCPEDFPYHIPTVNLEVRYKLQELRDVLGAHVVDNIDNWHLSTLDRSGAGAHADFVSGWPEEMMANAIEHCRRDVDPEGDGQCLLEPYFDTRPRQMEEKRVNFVNQVPDESISPVRQIPRGSCPPFVDPA